MLRHKQAGFTIVELLIVIVVIAILATISIVAYNGIQNRANDTAVQTDIRNFAGKVMEYHAINGSYPQGRVTGSVEGIPKFILARGSYDTSAHNFFYCESGGEFAVGATSKSGNRFFYSSNGGLRVYTGAWGTNSQVCPGMGMATGWTYSYAYYAVDGTWVAWAR